MPNHITQQDVDNAQEFAALIGSAKLELPLDRYPRMYQLLVWYNQLLKKLPDHIFELADTQDMEEEEPDAGIPGR